MSAFYDLASLVLVPSGYKASKVYAQKPLTTDGQLTFSRASTATRVNSAGLIETVSSNVPRLDYLGSTCPKLQLEPQRTNVLTQSSAFDNADWIKLDTTVTANAGTSPDGTANADKIVPSTTNARHILYQSITTSSTYTFSVFAKAAGQNFLTMRLDDDTPEVNVFFNLSTGTIGATAGGSPTMTSYGNGWYRCSVTYTPSGTENIYAVLGSANVNGSIGYAGNGTDGILIYGAQLELGAYATSYIPTTTAAVTRLKDNCVKTGVSSLIGQTEGTVFVEWVQNSLETTEDLYSNNKNLTGSISLQIGSTGVLSAFVCYNNAYILISTSSGAIQLGQRYKVAYAYKSGSIALYLNGALIGTSSASFAFTTTLSEIDIANNLVYFASAANKKVSQLLQFKTRLTNAQLAELTAL